MHAVQGRYHGIQSHMPLNIVTLARWECGNRVLQVFRTQRASGGPLAGYEELRQLQV